MGVYKLTVLITLPQSAFAVLLARWRYHRLLLCLILPIGPVLKPRKRAPSLLNELSVSAVRARYDSAVEDAKVAEEGLMAAARCSDV